MSDEKPEAGSEGSIGQSASTAGLGMTRAQYDQLSSNGKHACPNCGLKTTTPCGGCHCPPNESGYGTRHINKYHHKCSAPNDQAKGPARSDGPA